MNRPKRLPTIAGFVLHVLVAAPMILAGAVKLLNLFPEDAIEQMKKSGIFEEIYLIGVGEAIAGVLLLVPRTSSLGVLVTSGFWGGVICISMAENENYALGVVLLLFTWIGGYLRNPGTLESLFSRSPNGHC